jgi:hypothetical protein
MYAVADVNQLSISVLSLAALKITGHKTLSNTGDSTSDYGASELEE